MKVRDIELNPVTIVATVLLAIVFYSGIGLLIGIMVGNEGLTVLSGIIFFVVGIVLLAGAMLWVCEYQGE
jgi:hypothetical protein